jgi:hypothetical protein
MEGDYEVQGQTTCISREIGFQPLDIHRWLSAICGETAPPRRTMFSASTASSELHRQLSMSGIATALKDWFYVVYSHAKDPKETTGKGIWWAKSCLVFWLQIKQLLQTRWVWIISESRSYNVVNDNGRASRARQFRCKCDCRALFRWFACTITQISFISSQWAGVQCIWWRTTCVLYRINV